MAAPRWTRSGILSPRGLSILPRCTRKERCERSREPRRFASEVKQCVRLTVHPSNISVSQYNVLVRRWDGVEGLGEEPSPHQKGCRPTPTPRRAGLCLANKATPQQAGVKNVPLGMGEGSICRNVGEEALCIMDRKAGKTETPEMTGRVAKTGRAILVCEMGKMHMQKEKTGYGHLDD